MSSPSCFASLLTHCQNSTTQLLLSFLDSGDVLELVLLNSEIHERLFHRSGLLNTLFYRRRLQVEKSLYFDFTLDGVDAEVHLRQMLDRVATNSLSFTPEVRAFEALERQLAATFALCLDAGESQEHLDSLRLAMVEPELPTPELQRENVGEHCNTAIQMLLTNECLQERLEAFGEEPCALRTAMVERAEQIINFFGDSKHHRFLKSLRYTPETLTEYFNCGLPLLDLVQLLILYLNVHVNSVKKLIQCCRESAEPHQAFTEFLLRYMIFRNTVCGLENKYGFLFAHCQEAFAAQFKEYPSLPRLSLWRTALKLWARAMAEFHADNQAVFAELFVIEMRTVADNTVEEYISNPESPNNSSTECEFRKSTATNSEELTLIPPEQREALIAHYQEYLLDVSADQFSIHWCGSSEQKLAGAYQQMEQELLSQTAEYWGSLQDTFSSPVVVRRIASQLLDFTAEKLKPCTAAKLEQQMNQSLESFRDKAALSDNQAFKEAASCWKELKLNTAKTDKWIRYLAEEKGLAQESGSKYSMYFSTQETVDLQRLEEQIEQFKNSKCEVDPKQYEELNT